MFPDVEQALCDLIFAADLVDDGRVGTYTPADLDAWLPYVRVNRYGGGDDGVTDRASVDVSCFGASRADALGLSRTVHAFLLAGPHRTGSVLVDIVRTITGPVERPWANAGIRRFGGSYLVSTRRVLTP